MDITSETKRLDRVVKLISERAEVERQLLSAIVELFYGEPLLSDASTALPASPGKDKASLLTVNAFCERAHISRATLYRLMRDGDVSYYKLAGRTLFDEGHLADFLKRNQLKAMPTERANKDRGSQKD